ncbi:antitoxin [Streptomyces sp. NPDC003832]
MGLLDGLKGKLGPAKGKVSDLAHQHGGKIQHGLDKAARAVDARTKGKYSEKIHTGTGKAKEAVDRFAHKEHGEPEGPRGHKGHGERGQHRDGGTGTPPSSPPPAS